MKIYTRGGDKGRTTIQGKRVSKDDIRIECLGVLDEAVVSVGLLRSKLEASHAWQENLKKIQSDLMDIMGYMAVPKDKALPPEQLPINGAKFFEKWIDELEESLSSPSEYFILPGGTETEALCHLARVQVRKGERILITLNSEEPIEEWILTYINRLSDLFYTLSRVDLDQNKISEDRWKLFINKK